MNSFSVRLKRAKGALFALETLVSVILKKVYIIFIYKYWHYNLCSCYFEEDKNYTYSFSFALLQSSQRI